MANVRALTVRLSEAEYEQLQSEASQAGISAGLALYRRAFNDPTAVRRRGRPPRIAREQSKNSLWIRRL